MKMPSFEQQLKLTPLECEIITLKAILDMINGMINREAMAFNFQDPDSNISFRSTIYMANFNIFLVDFLSKPTGFFEGEKDYLGRLHDICVSPQLGNQHIYDLKASVKKLMDWLSEVVTVEKRWFPSIELEVDLKIKRQDFITICGNISNNFLNIMKENGQSIHIDQSLIALEDFYEQFHQDIFVYHSSTLAESLNNIRWGIYIYANAERERCVERWYDHEMQLQKYKYNFPPQIISTLGRTYFCNLLNDVINPPHIQRFEVTKYLQMRY